MLRFREVNEVRETREEKEGEMRMEVKDYVGYVLGNDVELEEFEKEFMDLERSRLDKLIPINDLKLFKENGIEEVKILGYSGLSERVIFEGLKGVSIMFNIIEKGDTYKCFYEKLSRNSTLKRMYNIITKNVFNMYEEAGLPDLDIA